MRAWKSNETVEVIIDETGKHRLKIVCTWNKDLPQCLFIMLNPSTADMDRCDNTLDRCINIARHNGFGSIAVVNLFSIRTPNSNDLLTVEVKTLPENMEYIRRAIDESKMIIAAWGEKGVWFNGNYPVLKYVDEVNRKLYCLKVNRYGMPCHPRSIKVKTDMKEYLFKDAVLVYS